MIGITKGRVSNHVVVRSSLYLGSDLEMRNGRLARGDPPEKGGRHCGSGDCGDGNLRLTMQTRALHPAALDRAVFLAARVRLGLWVVDNDSGCAGLFRIRNLRVVGAVAAL